MNSKFRNFTTAKPQNFTNEILGEAFVNYLYNPFVVNMAISPFFSDTPCGKVDTRSHQIKINGFSYKVNNANKYAKAIVY